jgi:hypothetical protein
MSGDGIHSRGGHLHGRGDRRVGPSG